MTTRPQHHLAPLCLALGLAGCGDKPPLAPPPEASPVTEPTILEDLPFPPDDAPVEEPSYEPTFGEPVERQALYVVDPVAGGKNLQAVSLHFDDGDVWIRAYRPVAEELQYADKRVVVTGRPYTNSPYVQSVMGTHFALDTIALAPGETARDPVPEQIPAPPQVESLASLQARVGLWAHCVGALSQLEEPGDDNPWWGRGSITLPDGTDVRLEGIPWDEHNTAIEQGSEITVLALVLAPEDGAATPSLGGRLRICEGRVERCLMDDDWR